MKKLFLFIFILSRAVELFSQQAIPVLLTALPISIIESSGVETTGISGEAWTHNDSGGLPEIYKVDTAGNLLGTVFLSGVTAIDFEDITRDSIGNIYVGDFGNNAGIRTDFRIYKISTPDSFLNDTIIPQQISFVYSTNDTLQILDCEAFFHFNQSLYLFTKSHNSGEYTQLYMLPDLTGAYTAILVDSFYFSSSITAADISPDGNTIALLSYGKIYLLNAFTGNNFFSGNVSSFTIPLSQTEGLAYINNEEFYITDEKYMTIGGNLYYLNIHDWLTGINNFNEFGDPLIYPNPTNGDFTITNEGKLSNVITIFDAQGKMIFEKVSDEKIIPISFSNYATGIYLVKVQWSNKVFAKKILYM